MRNREPTLSTARSFPGLALATMMMTSALTVGACNGLIGEPGVTPTGDGGTSGGNNPGTGGSTGSGAGGSGDPTGTGGTVGPGTGAGGSGPGVCLGDLTPNAKRVVRLSFNQVSVSVHQIFGDTVGNQIDSTALIGPFSSVARTFPPLASGQEGGTIIQKHWQTADSIASTLGTWAHDNLAAFATAVNGSTSTAPTTDAAAQTLIGKLAAKAWRRPLTTAETTSLNQVYTEVKTVYTTIPEAIQYSVYAIMQAPAFLYRTEVGTDKSSAGMLSPYELASQLSYFLTDGPPDAMLLQAAASNMLNNADQIGAQATRILATPAARSNLGAAMFSYFALDSLTKVVITDSGWTLGTAANPYSGVRESAYHEAELFLAKNLWDGPLSTLITGKTTEINAALAPLYGVSWPPAGVTLDAQGFGQVTLPNNRAGILTQVAFLAARSRPDVPSVVGRGLAVNAALLCAVNPPFPEDPAILGMIADAKTALANASERERAAYRGKTQPCNGCHLNFDAYGLALENYDIIGRYRTMDPEGRAIDPSVTLPANAGGATAANAVDMGQKIAAAKGFDSCISKNMINWALAEGSQLTPNSCSTQAVVTEFGKTDKSFSSLLKVIAQSQAFMNRTAGVN